MRTQPTMTRFLFTVLFFVYTCFSAVTADDFADSTVNTHSVILYRWPLSASSPRPWATVKYNPREGKGSLGDLDSVSAKGDELVRVGVWDGKEDGRWFGSVVLEKVLEKNPKVVLRVDEKGDVWHVEVRQGQEEYSTPSIALARPSPETVPHLNKPIVLRPDGKIPEPEAQKTFLQKYWWLLLGAAMLALTSGGAAAE
ncbi:hypothetical protein RUND412_000070 [Rhizina undulata]